MPMDAYLLVSLPRERLLVTVFSLARKRRVCGWAPE
jgi:hypothetical protein